MRHNPLPVTDPAFPALNAYWNDRDARARVDAETAHQREITNRNFDAALIASGNRWPAHWTDDEKADAERRGM